MKNCILFIVFIIPQVLFADNIEFPKDIKKCNYGNNECITESISHILKHKFQGEMGINLRPLAPLYVKSLIMQQGGNSPVNIDLKFTNNTLLGLDKTYATKTKGFSNDLRGPHELTLMAPSIELIGPYKINGKILILPIQGDGTSNITLIEPSIKMIFNGEPLVKNGKTYMKMTNFKLKLKIKRSYIKIDNLFNGDKALGDNMNLFLNENWKDIFAEIRTTVQDSFGKLFETIIADVFSSQPYKELFTSN